ncbi:MAG: hypothetical protein JSV80_09125, partial [Acidobacteriota bacterium]
VFLVTLVGCGVLERLIVMRSASFKSFMTTRVARMLGRMVLVLTVVGVGIGALNRSPLAVLFGALAGWLVVSAREAWMLASGEPGQHRRGGD